MNRRLMPASRSTARAAAGCHGRDRIDRATGTAAHSAQAAAAAQAGRRLRQQLALHAHTRATVGRRVSHTCTALSWLALRWRWPCVWRRTRFGVHAVVARASDTSGPQLQQRQRQTQQQLRPGHATAVWR